MAARILDELNSNFLKYVLFLFLQRGNSESEMNNWKMAIEEARKCAIVKVGNDHSSGMVGRPPILLRPRSLSEPTLTRIAITLNDEDDDDDDGCSIINFRRMRTSTVGSDRSDRSQTLQRVRPVSRTSTASALSTQSVTSSPTSKKFPNIPLQCKQLAMMYEWENNSQDETTKDLLEPVRPITTPSSSSSVTHHAEGLVNPKVRGLKNRN
jgi:hypothetical protein